MLGYFTPKADQQNISDLRSTADIVEEIDEYTTYLGFCSPGTANTAAPNWSILKIEQSGGIFPILTTFRWANGLCAFNLVWDNRAGYDYKFKNF
jgi:hypothetical protein